MLIREFRKDEFIDREKDIEYIKTFVSKTPKEILWLYGPKSTGKTTLIEYIIENELTSGLKIFDNYWIKYINFRGLMVGNYDNFISSFFEKADDQDDFTGEINTTFNLGVIRLEAKLLESIKKREKNLFNELIQKLKTINKIKIIIIDEIQTLEDIYYNGEKELLKEFLNFCVRLTKELHLAHVIILSSNTIFIERIYNDAKLKVTSEFKKIDHFDQPTIFDYLEYKGIKNQAEKELIWDYLGGCIPLVQRMLRKRDYYPSLADYLEREVLLAKNEIADLTSRYLDNAQKTIFKDIIKKIITNGRYLSKDDEDKKYIEIIDFFAQKEIFFYDPLTREVTGNNRLYEKAFEKIIAGL